LTSKKKLARSLLQLISFNIAEVAFLYAKLHGINRCLFTGNFIRNKNIIQAFINEAFSYFVDAASFECTVVSPQQCLFSKNEGFFGALAAVRKSLESRQESIA